MKRYDFTPTGMEEDLEISMRMAQNLAPYVRMVHRAPSFLGLSTASLSPSLFDTENYEFILDVVVPPKW